MRGLKNEEVGFFLLTPTHPHPAIIIIIIAFSRSFFFGGGSFS